MFPGRDMVETSKRVCVRQDHGRQRSRLSKRNGRHPGRLARPTRRGPAQPGRI